MWGEFGGAESPPAGPGVLRALAGTDGEPRAVGVPAPCRAPHDAGLGAPQPSSPCRGGGVQRGSSPLPQPHGAAPCPRPPSGCTPRCVTGAQAGQCLSFPPRRQQQQHRCPTARPPAWGCLGREPWGALELGHRPAPWRGLALGWPEPVPAPRADTQAGKHCTAATGSSHPNVPGTAVSWGQGDRASGPRRDPSRGCGAWGWGCCRVPAAGRPRRGWDRRFSSRKICTALEGPGA